MSDSFFNEINKNVDLRLKKKIKDSNVLKSNLANPHYKTVSITDVHRKTFASLYGRRFMPDEIVFKPKIGQRNKRFNVKTLERFSEIIQDNSIIVKPLKCNDCLMICPWMQVAEEINIDVQVKGASATLPLCQGRLVIPITQKESMMRCFVPCCGLDENDQVPDWVDSFSLMENFGLKLPYNILNSEEGIGKISVKKSLFDFGFIPKEQEINDDDLIKVRNDVYVVRGWNYDTFDPKLKSLRFTTDCKRNANSASYEVLIKPVVKGNFISLPETSLKNYRSIDVAFTKCQDLFGQINISYQNACFNSLGFLTHDIAV